MQSSAREEERCRQQHQTFEKAPFISQYLKNLSCAIRRKFSWTQVDQNSTKSQVKDKTKLFWAYNFKREHWIIKHNVMTLITISVRPDQSLTTEGGAKGGV